MPELAEAEFFRKRWHRAAAGRRLTKAQLHPAAKIFRGTSPRALQVALRGATLLSSEAQAKQMLFQFTGHVWIGIHLGMSGELHVEPADYEPLRHDHLVLATMTHALVFTDPRMFGRVLLHRGTTPPPWWTRIAPPILSRAFTRRSVTAFLTRHGRAPIKAVLLMQAQFPGVGNWMADEILWRAAIHPMRRAGSLRPAEANALWRVCRQVCRMALDTIAGRGRSLPPNLNAHIPQSWLFWHRWKDGGRCPQTGAALMRREIGGRTTCWSPARQRL